MRLPALGAGSRLARTSRTSSLVRPVVPASSSPRLAAGTTLRRSLQDVEMSYCLRVSTRKPNVRSGDFLLTPTICCLLELNLAADAVPAESAGHEPVPAP